MNRTRGRGAWQLADAPVVSGATSTCRRDSTPVRPLDHTGRILEIVVGTDGAGGCQPSHGIGRLPASAT